MAIQSSEEKQKSLSGDKLLRFFWGLSQFPRTQKSTGIVSCNPVS